MTPQRPSIPDIFKPEDFEEALVYRTTDDQLLNCIIHNAQQIFASWLESQNVVHGFVSRTKHEKPVWSDTKSLYDTHTAYLVCPTELKPEKCEHKEVYIFDLTLGNYAFKCRDCDKKVGPKNGWEEADET